MERAGWRRPLSSETPQKEPRKILVAMVLAALTTASLVLLFGVAYWLVPALPAFGSGSYWIPLPPEQVKDYPEFKKLEQRLKTKLAPVASQLNFVKQSGTQDLSPLVFVEFYGEARPGPNGTIAVEPLPLGLLRVRFDRLIWILVVTGLLAWGGVYFVQSLLQKAPSRVNMPVQSPVNMDFHSLIDAEISRLSGIADRLYRRSRLLLVSGILVAFSGVGTLLFLIPNTFLLRSERLKFTRVQTETLQDETDQKLLQDLQALLQASGLVLQIEFFAFILLRQYRSAFNDYTYFHNLRLRYVHYLAASKAVEAMQTPLEPQTGIYMANFLLGGDSFSPATSRKPGPPQDDESDGTDALPPSLDKLLAGFQPRSSGKPTSGNRGTP